MSYFSHLTPLISGTTVRAAPLNVIFDAVQTGFEFLPQKEDSEPGFASTVFIQDGLTADHAVNRRQLQNFPTFTIPLVDLGANRLSNALDPVNDQDLTTKLWVVNQTSSSVAAAQAAQSGAELAETNAQASEVSTTASALESTNAAVAALASEAASGLSETASASSAFTAAADAVLTAADRVVTTADRIATAADKVATNADVILAEDAKSISSANANYKGEWSSLAGALSIPASVKEGVSVYMLNTNLADVTLSQPSSNPGDWFSLGAINANLLSLSNSWSGANTFQSTLRLENAVNTGFELRHATSSFDSSVYQNAVGNITLISNWDLPNAVQSDLTKSTWYSTLSPQNDTYTLGRYPAGGVSGKLFGIDGNGYMSLGSHVAEAHLHTNDNLATPTRQNVIFRNSNAGGLEQMRVSLERGSDAGTGLARGGVLFATPDSFGIADYEARDIHFFTGEVAGLASERLSILTTGEVGIGSDIPTEKLHVKDGNIRIENSTDPSLLLKHDLSTFDSSIYQSVNGATVIGANWDSVSGTQPDVDIPTWFTNLNPASDFYKISRTAVGGAYSDLFTILGDGNVGIGTSTPTTKLHIQSSTVSMKLERTHSNLNGVVKLATLHTAFTESDANLDGDVGSKMAFSYELSDQAETALAKISGVRKFGDAVNEGSLEFKCGTDGNEVGMFLDKDLNLQLTGFLDGRDVAVDGSKLDLISASANNYSLPQATATARGGVELFSNTDQSVIANAVTTAVARTYGVQLNSSNQMVVNVPWFDTNTNTTYTAGTGMTLAGTTMNCDIVNTDTVYSHPGYTSRTLSFDTGVLSGATVISDLDFNITVDPEGHVAGAEFTTLNTRELTAADVGAATSVHNHNGTYALISGSGAQNFSASTLTATTVNATSDINKKKNIIEYQGQLGEKIEAYYYNWIEGDQSRQIGYIAQEVEVLLPGAVHTDKDGNKSLNYAMVHTAKIAELEKNIARLEKIIEKNIEEK